ncbi:integrase core domain-containing protein [Rhodococcus sp. LW-XY12]|nr:integrase core domain-containing protein [Rhodococcus sp. LW-XY12]
MGATGIWWDNSPSESFWSIFKHEEHYRHTYATKSELVAGVDSWVVFYNTVRRNSAVGMLSPDSFENSLRVEVA